MAAPTESYRELVAKLARKRTGEPVFNTSLDHATILVEAMFANARASVKILSGKLNARVYGPDEVIEQAKLFLADPSHKVKILVEDGSEENLREHPFFDQFARNANLEVKKVLPELRDAFAFHFIVMDGDSYRFEHDKKSPTAVAAFGDTKGASAMDDIFEDLWAKCTAVDLPQLKVPA